MKSVIKPSASFIKIILYENESEIRFIALRKKCTKKLAYSYVNLGISKTPLFNCLAFVLDDVTSTHIVHVYNTKIFVIDALH